MKGFTSKKSSNEHMGLAFLPNNNKASSDHVGRDYHPDSVNKAKVGQAPPDDKNFGDLATPRPINQSELAQIWTKTKRLCRCKDANKHRCIEGFFKHYPRPLQERAGFNLSRSLRKLENQVRGIAKGVRFLPLTHFSNARYLALKNLPYLSQNLTFSQLLLGRVARGEGVSYRRSFGFTLAEVLITLGIIGVVAAIVIPMVVANTQKSETYSKILKAQSTLAQAAQQIRDDNGGSFSNIISSTSSNPSLDMANLFKDKLKVATFCTGSGDDTNCWLSDTDEIKTLDGNSNFGGVPNNYPSNPKMVTTDGFVYIFAITDSACNSDKYQRGGVPERCGVVLIDTNSIKPPNTVGKDIFVFSLNKYNLTPYRDYSTDDYFGNIYYYCDKTHNDIWNGADCTAKAIAEGGINYY